MDKCCLRSVFLAFFLGGGSGRRARKRTPAALWRPHFGRLQRRVFCLIFAEAAAGLALLAALLQARIRFGVL